MRYGATRAKKEQPRKKLSHGVIAGLPVTYRQKGPQFISSKAELKRPPVEMFLMKLEYLST